MDILVSPVNSFAHGMLDVLTEQQKLLAKNIANANTEGYEPSYINFDKVMIDLESRSHTQSHNLINPEMHAETKSGNVQLDMELLQMQETVLQYKTILDALSRKGALMKTVMGGR
jgi:flagellar basal body rod protein FlgB